MQIEMPVHSGLSALIEAATTQLGNDYQARRGEAGADYGSFGHDHPSSDGGLPRAGGGMPLTSPDTTPPLGPEKHTFPEVLMALASHPDNEDVLTFLPDGKFFAIRTEEFSSPTSSSLMHTHFPEAECFEDFVSLLIQGWGFARIICEDGIQQVPQTFNSIEVFCHPLFRKGDVKALRSMKPSTSPEVEGHQKDEKATATPQQAATDIQTQSGPPGIEQTISEDSTSATKRQLSPGHVRRMSTESQKQKLVEDLSLLNEVPTSTAGSEPPFPPPAASVVTHSKSHDSATDNESHTLPTQSGSHRMSVTSTDSIRSQALAITTEKLSLRGPDDDEEDGPPSEVLPTKHSLVDGAVEKATKSIVTDAIESLLRDEEHTRSTFLKHEEELSKATLPGVVPLSKQLFSISAGADSTEDVPVTILEPSSSTGDKKARAASEEELGLEDAAARLKQQEAAGLTSSPTSLVGRVTRTRRSSKSPG